MHPWVTPALGRLAQGSCVEAPGGQDWRKPASLRSYEKCIGVYEMLSPTPHLALHLHLGRNESMVSGGSVIISRVNFVPWL